MPWCAQRRASTLTFVEWIDKDDLVELERGVLRDPVGVQHTQRGTTATNALFRDRLERALKFQLVDTLVFRLAVHLTLGHWLLARAAANADTVDDLVSREACEPSARRRACTYVAGLGFVAHAAGFLRSGGLGRAVNGGELSVMPCANTEDKAHDITLLFTVDLLQVFVGTHDVACVCS